MELFIALDRTQKSWVDRANQYFCTGRGSGINERKTVGPVLDKVSLPNLTARGIGQGNARARRWNAFARGPAHAEEKKEKLVHLV